ncbi:MAG: metallophosphoesterase [Synechococcus sp. ELA057]|jgi:Icc protein
MRLLQLSDPHLLADPQGLCRGRQPYRLLEQALRQAHDQLQAAGTPADRLLISGDLCQDESWGGYRRLEELLAASPFADLPPPWLLCGNHDHPLLLRAALGRQALVAPRTIETDGWQVLLLDSHRSGAVSGRLGTRQLAWISAVLAGSSLPLLVALHHPPGPIGDALLDGIALEDGGPLLDLLAASDRCRAVVFGHIHQHWSGCHRSGGRELPLLGCPSTLCPFPAVQPCPLGRPQDPGGRLLELLPGGEIRQSLLRWSLPQAS